MLDLKSIFSDVCLTLKPHYLILFFDSKRTWQWLQRDKLEPLGINMDVDKVKMVSSKKPTDRKAVKKAYEDAILHRCRVTGENVTLSRSGLYNLYGSFLYLSDFQNCVLRIEWA